MFISGFMSKEFRGLGWRYSFGSFLYVDEVCEGENIKVKEGILL